MTVDLLAETPAYDEPTTVEKLRKLPYAIGFDGLNSLFAQLTYFGSVFVLYLNTLGFNKTQIGFVLSLLPFLVVASLFSGSIVDRLGNKRTCLLFWTIRTIVTAGLVFVPWVLEGYGSQVALIYIAAITASFSLFKAIALTGLIPWQQEYVPESIRGKYFAYSNISISIAGLFAMGVSGFVLNRTNDLSGYTLLFGLGVIFALVSINMSARLPGGKSHPAAMYRKRRFIDTVQPIKDRSFFLFLIGSALLTLAAGPLGSFLPLYMEEKVGLISGDIVLLGVGTLLGGLLSSYFWGWTSDRYGSRPVMMTGLLFKAFYPLLFVLVPRSSSVSMPIAMGVYFYGGFATMGWAIGSSRLLYGSLIPRHRGQDYSAVYHSWLGVFGGLSALLGGWILDRSVDFQRMILGVPLDAYFILFAAAAVTPLLAMFILRWVKSDSSFSVGEFAGLFYHGNPIMAMESMIRFHRAKDESSTISLTERLGQSHSPLTVEELLLALADPRFLVRFEALVSIGRHGPDERLRKALVEILHGDDPALAVISAWALGRMRDPLAIEPLREALDSRYRSVRAHAARSLAGLEDIQVVGLLEERLLEESDFGLRVAYSASLAKLNANQVSEHTLDILRTTNSEIVRKEMALSLARLIGDEASFIQLLRQVNQDAGTALSQATAALRKDLESIGDPEILSMTDDCAMLFARNDLDRGAKRLAGLMDKLPSTQFAAEHIPILKECLLQTKYYQGARLEYPILLLQLLRESFTRTIS